MIILTIIRAILAIAAVVSFVWMVVGLPAGIIISIIYFTTKEVDKRKKLSKWIKISFMGILVIIAVFILYAVLGFVSTLLGYRISNSIPIPY
jgi:hypothetical protein